MSTPCPDCGAALTGGPTCAACGLSVTGPLAGRLWVVDQELAALRAERVSLIERLRGTAGTTVSAAPVSPPAAWAPPPRPPVRETSPQSVQNTLLGIGALLLAVAGLVFAAVTYNHLGVVGRAAVLLALTLAAFAAAGTLLHRGLRASAEAVAVVGVVLSGIDAWAARRAGLAEGMDPAAYAAVSSGVLAVLMVALWTALPLRTPRIAAVVLGQGPLVLGLIAAEPSPATAAALLALLVAADAVLVLAPLDLDLRLTAAGFGALWTALTLVAAGAAFSDEDRAGAIGVVLLAVLAGGLATRLSGETRQAAAAAVAPLLAYAAWGASLEDLTRAQQPLVLVAVALLALQATALLRDRLGAVAGALLVAGAALLAEGEGVVEAVGGPLTWIGSAWELEATSARDAVAVGTRWDGTVVTLVVLAGAAAAALAAGLLLDRLRQAVLPAAVLAVVATVALPLGLATSYHAALVIQVAVAVGFCAAGWRLLPLAFTGLGLLGLTTAWSLAEQDATLTVMPVAALVTAALAVRLPGALTGAAVCLAAGELAAYGVTQDLSVDQVGALLLAAPAVAVALSFVLPGAHRLGVEAAALVTGAVAVLLTVEDAGWLSWSLSTTGLLALAVAVRSDRRVVGYLGALLLAGSSWVRLADADVTAPEPYVVPLAVMTLVIGWLRRRQHPTMGSFEAYAGGLVLALVPSLLKSFDDPTPTRGVLLLAVGAAVVLVGAQAHLRAPLLVGGGVVVLDALHLLAPYAAALPRWVVLAAAGAALVAVGATYEQRLRDVNRLRERYESWA